MQERLWILVVESKRTSIPVPAALPQLLAYLLAWLEFRLKWPVGQGTLLPAIEVL